MNLSLLLGCVSPTSSTLPPLQQDAFVWQMQWPSQVSAAVTAHGGAFDRLTVLRAEVTWDSTQPRIRWVEPDRQRLRQTGRPVGFAIRVRVPPEDRWDLAGDVVSELVAEMIGHDPWIEEVHLDVDAPTAKLDRYAGWLAGVDVGDRMLSVTALPDWLRSAQLPMLLNSVDEMVLQVHWLRPPGQVSDPLALMEIDALPGWLDAAARLDRPFSVALPTYGYQVGFDPISGQRIAGHAETGRMDGGAVWREVRADPAALATLIDAWSTERPARMRGVRWYRLPVEGDVLNWRWVTLDAVMKGRVPVPDLRLLVEHREDGLMDLRVTNRGDAGDALPPVGLSAGGHVVVADGLGGVRWSAGARRWTPARPIWIAPGADRPIGWARVEGEVVPSFIGR
ncbi:MAG: DUF3142 domain-containing protein [Myxococcota bacterium]